MTETPLLAQLARIKFRLELSSTNANEKTYPQISVRHVKCCGTFSGVFTRMFVRPHCQRVSCIGNKLSLSIAATYLQFILQSYLRYTICLTGAIWSLTASVVSLVYSYLQLKILNQGAILSLVVLGLVEEDVVNI